MIKRFAAIGLAISLGTLQACSSSAQAVQLEDDKAKVSYGIGLNIGASLERQGMAGEMDLEALAAGIKDALEGNEQKLTDEEIRAAFKTYQEKMQAKQQAEDEKTKEESQQFLAENANKDDVVTTDSGLQYKVLQSGNGAKPEASDTVKVHYHGTLIDGTVFDSSVERGEPVEFRLDQVIPGWTEGLQLMEEGAKYKFFIPADLAYGPMSPSPKIPANSALIFEVELLNVVDEPKGEQSESSEGAEAGTE